MLKKLDELTKADLKHQFRQLYYELGFEGATQILYELIETGTVLSEVILEELQNKDLDS